MDTGVWPEAHVRRNNGAYLLIGMATVWRFMAKELGLRVARKHIAGFIESLFGVEGGKAHRGEICRWKTLHRSCSACKTCMKYLTASRLMIVPNEKLLLDALPQPVISIGSNRHVTYVTNFAAQEFFGSSLNVLRRQHIIDVLPFGSPVISLVERCLDNNFEL